MRIARLSRTLAALALLLALPGCFLDPYQREGAWRPGAINDANLRLQVADPRDLRQGSSEPGSDGQLAADAVSRLRTSRNAEAPVAQLPTQSSAASIASTGGSTGTR